MPFPPSPISHKGHAPVEWMIVNQSPLVVSSACTCGHEFCCYTATVHEAVNILLEPTSYVKV